MAMIKYNGMELEEVTKPHIFDPPKKCVCWNDEFPLNKSEAYVAAILPVSSNWIHRVFVRQQNDTPGIYSHCALLPDHPKPRRATNRELARWLIEGKAQIKHGDSDMVYVGWNYKEFEDDLPCSNDLLVRRWEDTEWHEPTVDYMGLEDK